MCSITSSECSGLVRTVGACAQICDVVMEIHVRCQERETRVQEVDYFLSYLCQ